MERLHKLRDTIKELNLDAVLITNPENRHYFSGFTGSAGALMIGATEAYIMTDFRYWEQVSQQAPEFILAKQGPEFWQSIARLTMDAGWNRVGFEAEQLTYNDFQKLQEVMNDISLTPINEQIKRLRWSKEEREIQIIADAAKITDLAWKKALDLLKPGVKERDLALEFDYQLRLNGAEGSAFTTIVASGFRSALPHGAASEKEIQYGELVIVDGGALYQGYHADMTRTVVLGKADEEQRRIYHIVLESQQRALDYLHAGLLGKEVDAVARDYIAQAGFGDKFGHGLGHSVGLEIHESPRLSISESNHIPVNAVVTVEPGIYLPDWGGVRIEDLVVVEEEGIRNLTGSPKNELLVI